MLMNSTYQDEINKLRGWGFKDWKSFIGSKVENFSMNFLLAASERHFYGIMANEKTNNSEIFWYFLRNVWNYRTRNIDDSSNSFWFVVDNASIHKTAKVKDLWSKNWLRILTIPSYWPSLNPIETVIHAIKLKIKQRKTHGK